MQLNSDAFPCGWLRLTKEGQIIGYNQSIINMSIDLKLLSSTIFQELPYKLKASNDYDHAFQMTLKDFPLLNICGIKNKDDGSIDVCLFEKSSLKSVESVSSFSSIEELLHILQTYTNSAGKDLGLLLLIEALYLDEWPHVVDPIKYSQLQEMARKRVYQYAPADAIVLILGPSLFAILLPKVLFPTDADYIVQIFLDNLEENFFINHKHYDVSFCVGAAWADPNSKVQSWFERAQIALRKAKKNDRHIYQFYQPHLYSKHHAKHKLLQDLKEAIPKNQLHIFYQPRIRLKDNAIVGYEALVRWQHPIHGLLSPTRFTKLAEDHGFIREVTAWVLNKACDQTHKWHQQGFTHLTCAVNVSPLDFLDQSLMKDIKSMMITYDIKPQALELEITESVFINDVSRAVAMIKKLRELGVRMVIDDFGTGFSALSYLQDIPIDKLKIDRHFIETLTGSIEEKHVIIEAIIELAHKLGLTVVAEGIENSNHLEWLRKHHCDEGQGYYYSEPVTADVFEHLLKIGFS